MKYLSVCSGVEAATVAWHLLGWKPVAFSEIEKFPSAVLAHHYPSVPNLGDMTKFHEWPEDLHPDVLVGGTPCQSFSVAGLRKGLADPRGNLMLTYLAIADRYRPQWLVWENVPGVLSSAQGRDFGAFLGALGKLGYGWSYRVLDAQYFGVPQRRRRVYVVGCLGAWQRASAVLFERHGLQGHPAPSRGKGQGFTHAVAPSLTASGRGVERTGESRGQDPVVAHTLRGEGFDASEDGTGRGVPLVMAHDQANAEVVNDGSPSLTCNHEAPILVRMREGKEGGGKGPLVSEDQSLTLATRNDQVVAYSKAVHTTGHQGDRVVGSGDVHPALAAQGENNGGGAGALTQHGMQVRRLSPVECERLQGFPDNYTNIPWRGKPESPDGPRYKALGNSMAVPVMRWIGERIALVEQIR